MIQLPRSTGEWASWTWWAIGALIVAALVVPPGHAGDSLGVRRFLTPEVGRDWRIAQAFRMNAPRLEAIELRASAVGPVSGSLQLRLHDESGTVERVAHVRAADLVRGDSYMFGFAPIEESDGRWLRLEVLPSPDAPGRGVALWATKGERLEPPAGLLINDTPRWASLAFQTHVPPVSLLRALVTARDPDRPPRWLARSGGSVWRVGGAEVRAPGGGCLAGWGCWVAGWLSSWVLVRSVWIAN